MLYSFKTYFSFIFGLIGALFFTAFTQNQLLCQDILSLKSNVVKIDLDESGTGLIVGESNSDYYILTAKHVIVNSKLNIIEAGDLDLAIFSYPKSKISSTVNKRIVIGRANLSDCYLGQDVQALGYMAGSKSLDIVSSKIQSINPYGVSEFFFIRIRRL